MELVYLWVEDYKNIHKQGFNFSPRFHCNYNEEQNELTIKENKDYIENFFGENINVTAIVGKNGSGKSSLLELVSFIIASKEFSITFMLLTFSEKDGFTLYLNNISPKENFETKRINIQEQNKNDDIFGIFYSNNFTNGSFDNETGWFSTVFRDSLDENEFEENTFYFKGRTNENLLIQSMFNLFINSPKYLSELKVYSYSDGKGYFGSGQLKSLIYHAKTILIARFLQGNIKNIPFEVSGEIAIHINENRYKKNTNILDSIGKYVMNPHQYDIISLLQQGNDYNDFYIVNFDIFFRILEIYLDYIFNSAEAIDFLQFEFSSLSSGEENYILMLSLLESGINSHLNKGTESPNIILLLDEPEHTFHPEWQKKTINYLLSFLNSIIVDRDEVKFHILLTSHSPFLLSDLSKDNIVFLEDGKNNKGINHTQTFGANIHTLLSDSFFMEDGLMGEFAKSKINEIIDFHKEVEEKNSNKEVLKTKYLKNQKKFWQTQKIIGEEYLKQVIKNHLVEIEKKLLGKDRAKQEEIKRVEAYLESLKK